MGCSRSGTASVMTQRRWGGKYFCLLCVEQEQHYPARTGTLFWLALDQAKFCNGGLVAKQVELVTDIQEHRNYRILPHRQQP